MNSRRLLDVLVGLYIGALVVTTSALLRWESVTPKFPVGIAVGTGLAIAVVMALVAGTVDDLAERVTSWPAVAVIWGSAVGYFLYLLVVLEPGSTQALIAATGTVASGLGFSISSVGNTIETRRLRGASTEIAAVTVGNYDGTTVRSWHLVGKNLLASGLVTLLIGTIALVGVDTDLFQASSLFGFLGLNLFRFLADDDCSKIVVTDIGVSLDQYTNGSVDQSFTRWDEFEGYRITDGAVELVPTKKLVSTQEFDLEEISDGAALIDGLAMYLPRLDEEDKIVDRVGRSTPEREYR